MLQPRKFRYKSRQKVRQAKSWNFMQLNYGDSGVFAFRTLRMSSKQIFRLKVSLKRAIKKPDVTKRKVWFALFPHLPLTKKPKGNRMGKGVGKLNTWAIFLRGGSIFLEFKNLRHGRALYFFKKIQTKLPVRIKSVFAVQKWASIRGVRRGRLPLRIFYD